VKEAREDGRQARPPTRPGPRRTIALAIFAASIPISRKLPLIGLLMTSTS
jgi:hypothetical protein